ncbi:hypothetical protein ACFX13_000535 [Malus domestica]
MALNRRISFSAKWELECSYTIYSSTDGGIHFSVPDRPQRPSQRRLVRAASPLECLLKALRNSTWKDVSLHHPHLYDQYRNVAQSAFHHRHHWNRCYPSDLSQTSRCSSTSIKKN